MRLLDLFCCQGGGAMGYATELAWAAGFFDGEGSVSVHCDKRPGRTPSFRLEIEQVDIRPLERFQRAVGGFGNLSKRSGPRAPNRRVLFRLYASNEPALRIAVAIWPHLSEPKREQITRVIEELEARRAAKVA